MFEQVQPGDGTDVPIENKPKIVPEQHLQFTPGVGVEADSTNRRPITVLKNLESLESGWGDGVGERYFSPAVGADDATGGEAEMVGEGGEKGLTTGNTFPELRTVTGLMEKVDLEITQQNIRG